jgi:hypothetical protein
MQGTVGRAPGTPLPATIAIAACTPMAASDFAGVARHVKAPHA